MADSGLTEKELTDVAKKTLDRDYKGAAEAIATLLLSTLTGQTLAGFGATKLVSAITTLLADSNTQKFLEAGRDVDAARARAAAFTRRLLEALETLPDDVGQQSSEQSGQLRVYLERNLASAEGQARLLEALREIREGTSAPGQHPHDVLVDVEPGQESEPYRPFSVDLIAELVDLCSRRDESSARGGAELAARISELHTTLSKFRPPRSGDIVAGARLQSVIDSGEFGTVWRGTLTEDDRPCAVKVFHAQRLSTGHMAREFRQGVAAMRLLTHAKAPSSIVHFYDADDAELAFSMTLIEGKDLRNLRSRRWSLERKLQVYRELCDAVKFAHANKVIHRDLKPANLLIEDATGRVVLTDFDLADLLTLGTLTMHSHGSFAYAAPEQLEPAGLPARAPRLLESDIYSLGRILLFLITGSDPPGLYLREIPELPELREHEGLRRIVRRCTLKDPSHRYRSVDELLVDLRGWQTQPTAVGCGMEAELSGHKLTDIPPQAVRRSKGRKSPWRHPVVKVLGVIAAAVVTAIGAITAAMIVARGTADAARVAMPHQLGPTGTGYGSPAAGVSKTLGQSPKVPPSALAVPSSTPTGALEIDNARSSRMREWLERGKGAHSDSNGTRRLRETKLALRQGEVQIGDFLCRLDFDEHGNPTTAGGCKGLGLARTAVRSYSLECMQSSDRDWVYCSSPGHFDYYLSPGVVKHDGRLRLELQLR